jgi:glycosyltransferase involved in cell wall biosynthesis
MEVQQPLRTSVFVAQIGARRHYAVPRALAAAGLLERLHTDIALPMPFELPEQNAKLLPAPLRRLLARHAPGIPVTRISTSPFFAFSALWDRRPGEPEADRWTRRNARFGNLVVERGFGGAGAVYGFNGAALEVFRAARNRGLATILDQTAAPLRWNRRILSEELEKWPGWEVAPGDLDASGRLTQREEEEWRLADRIVCGSTFVRDALATCDGPAAKRCAVVPYPVGAPWVSHAPARERGGPGRKVRLLFVGTLQLRKGVQYLAAALQKLPAGLVEARLVGPTRLSHLAMRELERQFEIAGARPRSEMAKEYAWADIFVLPTLSEGSANVCHEAMSTGLPVITTPNAGSTVEHEKNGLIVSAGDAAGITEAIERLARDADLRHELGQEGSRRAAPAGLNDYAFALADVVAAATRSRRHEPEVPIPA